MYRVLWITPDMDIVSADGFGQLRLGVGQVNWTLIGLSWVDDSLIGAYLLKGSQVLSYCQKVWCMIWYLCSMLQYCICSALFPGWVALHYTPTYEIIGSKWIQSQHSWFIGFSIPSAILDIDWFPDTPISSESACRSLLENSPYQDLISGTWWV